MANIKKQLYWGYLDDRGVIHIKNFTHSGEIKACEQMSSCKGIFDVFEARDYANARAKIAKFLDEQQFNEKKKFN